MKKLPKVKHQPASQMRNNVKLKSIIAGDTTYENIKEYVKETGTDMKTAKEQLQSGVIRHGE